MKIKPKSGWRDIPIGGTIEEAGCANEYITGTWRTYRPVWHSDGCVQCLRCWVYCPDSSVKVDDGKIAGTDYDHCKGCGICVRHCPRSDKEKYQDKIALEMVLER